ncbi:hypothetical protein GCM10025868_38390 [Angustibacter aerolatus]|uniref:CNNM transmembrane domain-containing protein n=1 Tax=Angustibacter aerolatus TaxID=1162965 RepID=A0ABQ6JL40_9ACTN|nr:CNNM domain-containing protein [Angustibacter aerolatus]GMA88589.1 hypothetical protein GCM10025868_38390 [Angustibacter aerolatus]
MTEWLLVLVSVVLTAGTALFVAAEFAFVALDRGSVERSVAAGDQRSQGVLTALRRLSTMLSASQVGITLTTLLVGFLAEPSVASLLEGPLHAAGLPDGAVDAVSVALALVLATAFSMVLGEPGAEERRRRRPAAHRPGSSPGPCGCSRSWRARSSPS